MSKPKIADTKPIALTLEKGDHFWCSCGRSSNQPWCDGSHAGTGFAPVKMSTDSEEKAHLCMCKYTDNPGYCDGSHAKLPKDDEASDAPSVSTSTSVPEEPTLAAVKQLAREGTEGLGHHGEMGAMGVPRPDLPRWEDIQILPAQLAEKPLQDDASVGTDLVIGPNARRPLQLDIPIFVSDMSFGALSEEAKVALARGADAAGTGICSGEGGMLPEEQQENARYLYELGSGKFGFHDDLLKEVQAFHFKAGQAAKTGTGGHLPGSKVVGKIASVRCLDEGTPAVSPPTFQDMISSEEFQNFAEHVREVTGGIPIGMKMSANRIEADLAFALEVRVDYIILDGRGGGTGAAPLIFRNNISVPTMAAIARARRYLDDAGASGVTLIATGGLRLPEDFVKAMALGADGVAIANSAMQSIGCVAARICNTNNCPAGIATQKADLRQKLDVDKGATQLTRFLRSSTSLMQVLARACGHTHLSQFDRNDITSWKREIADLAGITFAGPA